MSAPAVSVLLMLLLTGCAGVTTPPSIDTTVRSVVLAPGVERLEYRSGQLLMTDSGGPSALFFALFSERFAAVSHVGVLAIEAEGPVVYETYGRLRARFGGRPTDFVSGQVERTPLAEFVEKGRYVEIYEPPPQVDRERLVGFMREHYDRRTPFDPFFDTIDQDALYCTELVALALEAAGAEPLEPVPIPDRPSLTIVRRWLGIDGPGTLHAYQIAERGRLVGTISILRSQAKFPVYIALKRELHRRFTPDQRLGNLFEWNGRELGYRPALVRFFEDGLRMYRGASAVPDGEQIDADVRRLAAQMFGPLASDPVAAAAVDGGPLSRN